MMASSEPGLSALGEAAIAVPELRHAISACANSVPILRKALGWALRFR
jgi:hypothetical protein